MRAAGWTETPTVQTFADVPPGSTFYLAVERMAERGILSGYPAAVRVNGVSPRPPAPTSA